MSEPLHVAERGPFYVSLRNAAQRIAYAEEIVRRLNSFNLHGSPLREG